MKSAHTPLKTGFIPIIVILLVVLASSAVVFYAGKNVLNLSKAGEQEACKADINKDGVVNSADQGLVHGNYGQKDSPYDVNGDGVINSADLGLISKYYGQSCLANSKIAETQETVNDQAAAPQQAQQAEQPSSQESSYVGTATCDIRGDVNKDGVVNSLDQGLVVSSYGKSGSKFDPDQNGTVNSADLGIVSADYGKSCQGTVEKVEEVTASGDNLSLIALVGVAKCKLTGDVNLDGVVNSADMGLVNQNFGRKNSPYDANNDGVINSADLGIVSTNYGKNCSIQDVPVKPTSQAEVNRQICTLKGDANKDNVINSADMGLLTQNYGSNNSQYDVTGDGVINSADLGVASANYGQSCLK